MTTDGRIERVLTFHGLEEFVAMAEEGSLTAAARFLDVPRTTLSRRLGELEGSLGVKLAERSTRRFVLTRAGRQLYQRGRELLRSTKALRDDVAQLDNVPRGLLRVSIPGGPEPWRGDMLGSFLSDHPEVDLEVTDGERLVDLHREEVDVVVRAGEVFDQELVGRVVSPSALVCVASSDYIAAHGHPQTPEELSKHNCALWITGDGRVPIRRWPLEGASTVDVSGRFASGSLVQLLTYVTQGHGVGLLPDHTVGAGLGSGTLVRLLEGIVGQRGVIRVLYTATRYQLPTVKTFVRHVSHWYKKYPLLA